MKQHRLVSVVAACLTCLASPQASTQVCATPGLSGPSVSLAGVLNSYYPGTSSSLGSNSTSIPVGGIDTSSGGSSVAIATGDLLIVMQMQGAAINSSNSDCYGDGSGTAGCATRNVTTGNYAGGNLSSNYLAGNWEYCTAIGPVSGGSVPVRCAGGSGGTVNSYAATAATTSTGAYRYQVIRVPQYSSATLAGTVLAAAWNGQTGGVVALQAAGTLNLAGNTIDASRRGFRGGGVTFIAPYGPPLLDATNGTSFYRAVAGVVSGGGPGGEREGEFKGEGIAGTPRLVYNGTSQIDTGVEGYPNGSRGRGAPGNAGGGGNNQNSGGGGGGNGGLGGNGGGGWNDVSRPTTFRDSGGHGGDGASRAGNNLALNVNRVIMGGGGGAGHPDGGGTNCELGAWGGNGGGIVIVKAGQFSGSGSLLADGNDGFRPNFTSGGCTDAAGGGGAGGSVYVAADSGGLGAITINARGGNGVNSSYAEHGPGGGGGGGVVRYTTSGSAPSITVTGGINGRDANGVAQGGFPATPQAWFSTPGANSSIASASTPAVQATPPATTCLPNLSITKTTTTPSISTSTGASATYSMTVTNSNAGASVGTSLVDNALPTGWSAQTVSAITFTPALSATVLGGYVEGATPGQPAVANSPGTAANLAALASAPSSLTAPFIGKLTIPGNGSATVTYSVAIPDTASAGTYHNSAGVQYLDPTRTTATRVIAPGTNNTANRCSTPSAVTTGCSASGNAVAATANTTYQTGGAVPGSNYSGTQAGLATENVTLLPDLSVTKTASGATFLVGGSGQQYTIIGRNNGRAVADQLFLNTQASDELATALVAPSVSVVDTLPAGITVSSLANTNPSIWTCTPNGSNTVITCNSTTSVYPMAAASDLVNVTATVLVSAGACPGPATNSAVVSTPAMGDADAANNTGTALTPINCAADLAVAKTNGVASVVTGSTTNYNIVVSNNGPGSADGATVSDPPVTGLTCTVTNCTGNGGAVCPVSGLWPNLLSVSGVALGSFPTGASATFAISCTVTATGL